MSTFTAPNTRRELQVRLAEAMTSDEALASMVHFLRDDFAYAPTNRSIIGPVLRGHEFVPWRDLMNVIEWDAPLLPDYAIDRVRQLSGELLAEIEAD